MRIRVLGGVGRDARGYPITAAGLLGHLRFEAGKSGIFSVSSPCRETWNTTTGGSFPKLIAKFFKVFTSLILTIAIRLGCTNSCPEMSIPKTKRYTALRRR